MATPNRLPAPCGFPAAAVRQRRRLTARGAAGVLQIATAAVERHFHTPIDNQLQTRLDEASAQATAALDNQQQALLEELRATCAPPLCCTSLATCLSQRSAVDATGTLTSALAPGSYLRYLAVCAALAETEGGDTGPARARGGAASRPPHAPSSNAALIREVCAAEADRRLPILAGAVRAQYFGMQQLKRAQVPPSFVQLRAAPWADLDSNRAGLAR